MIRVSKRWFDVAVATAIGLIPVALLSSVFDDQVPQSTADDISARIYPDTLCYAWLLLSGAHLLETLIQRDTRTLSVSAAELGFQAVMLVVVVVGYIILNTLGYIAGAAFYIFAFTWLLRERGWAARILALATPLAVYLILALAFDVRLPSAFDGLWRYL